MSHLGRIGNQINVTIRPDREGYIGRECPKCEYYFNVTPGTGITTGDPQCHCPYCGHAGKPDTFYTKDQIEYAKSVAIGEVVNALHRDLKRFEFDIKPRGMIGIGMSLKVEGRRHPIQYYRETQLETELICDNCTLRYTIYGVFAFCPDCGRHNSRQILDKNLELAGKQIHLAASVEGDLSDTLVADALENVVSAFDGFGREICRVHADKATNPTKAREISFQNLAGSRWNVQNLFGFDLSADLEADDWDMACRSFQKRHLLAHRTGVIDEDYIKKSGDIQARVGRKVSIVPEEVQRLIVIVSKMGAYLADRLLRMSIRS